MRAFIVGDFHSFPSNLAISYKNAFSDIYWDVQEFDIFRELAKHRRFGRIGQFLDALNPIEAWIKKANRSLIIECRKSSPDIVLVVGGIPVQAGALAQIHASVKCKIVFVWPDTLLNLNQSICQCLPLYDLVASYSESAVTEFQRLGAHNVKWIPLACDPHLYQGSKDNFTENYQCDVSFVGNWRPEREAAIVALSHIPNLSVRVWGSKEWGASANAFVRGVSQGKHLYPNEFAQIVRTSKLSLNIIDDTNFPAANMRFFEIPCAGGVQLSSSCPEMQTVFQQGREILYYDNLAALSEQVEALVRDSDRLKKMTTAAQELVLGSHTYVHRAQQILHELGNT